MVHFDKSYPEPECLKHERLKSSGTHNCEGVFTRLILDFHHKCYLCEKQGGSDLEIEHFIGHAGSKELRLKWENLFLVCGHCNNTKQAVASGATLLDCTDPHQLVDQWMSYRMPLFPKENRVVIEPLIQPQDVLNTAMLLSTVFNGHKKEQKVWNSYGLRTELHRELTGFLDHVRRYLHVSPNNGTRARLRQSIIAHLQNSSAFTAFKRWIIRDNPVLMAEFGETF